MLKDCDGDYCYWSLLSICSHKRKAYHGCSILVGTEEEIKRTGHSTPAIRAILERGAHQQCSAISDVCNRHIYMYKCLYK